MTEREKQIINALVILLDSNVGYEIGFFRGMLSTYQLEDGRFVVNRKDYIPNQGDKYLYEEIFDSSLEAAEFFEKKRREHELGFDFERELNQRENEH